jgi:hypothetical protein
MSFKKFLDEKEMMEKNDDVKDKIIDFFINNPNPPDSEIHQMAEDLGIEHDKFEAIVYSILSDFLSGGRSKGQEVDADPNELSMGIKVEKEHTDNERLATKIANDHLSEIPDYYTRLKKMESEAGIKD